MTEQRALIAFKRLSVGKTVTSAILGSCLLLLGVPRAQAATITWHWAGTVTGYVGATFGPSLETVVPLGTTVDVFVSFDPDAPYLNPAMCLQGMASASLQVLGQTYTNQGVVWVDAMGFGPGICSSLLDNVEIVVPSWGFGGPPLAGDWVRGPSPDFSFLPGLWWGGDLTSGQPAFIGSQFPYFHIPGESASQRFTANLQAVPDLQPVPEPSTWLLLGTGVAAAWRRRRQ